MSSTQLSRHKELRTKPKYKDLSTKSFTRISTPPVDPLSLRVAQGCNRQRIPRLQAEAEPRRRSPDRWYSPQTTDSAWCASTRTRPPLREQRRREPATSPV